MISGVFLKILGEYEKVIVQWPSILSLIFLLGRFVFILIKDVRIHLKLEEEVSLSKMVEIILAVYFLHV